MKNCGGGALKKRGQGRRQWGSVDNNNSIISYEKRPSSCATTVIALSGRCTFLRFFILIIYLYYYQLETKRISTKQNQSVFLVFFVLFHNLHSFGFECYLKTGIFRSFLLVGAFSRTHTHHPTRSAARRCVITALLCTPFRTCVDFSSVSFFLCFLLRADAFSSSSAFVGFFPQIIVPNNILNTVFVSI